VTTTSLPLAEGVSAFAIWGTVSGRGGDATDAEYRYTLHRTWDEGPHVNFVMLNPSVASEVEDDRTIRKCQKLARTWGYCGIIVTNIFAFRAMKPKDMKAAPDPVGPLNDHWIELMARVAGGPIVAAWGNHGAYRARGAHVLQSLVAPRAADDQLDAREGFTVMRLGPATDGGHPWHPLYTRDDVPLVVHRHPWSTDG
jgi:hypothetical protein